VTGFRTPRRTKATHSNVKPNLHPVTDEHYLPFLIAVALLLLSLAGVAAAERYPDWFGRLSGNLTDTDCFAVEVLLLCTLLFSLGVTLIVRYPEWFR